MSDMQFTVTRGRRAAQSHPLFRGAHLLESSAASIYDEMACSSRTGTRFIFEAGLKLRFSEESIATACVYYHKFYQVMNRDEYNDHLVIMAVLNLAAKAREVPVKLSDVVNTCHRCLHPNKPELEVGDVYWHLKDSAARYELLLLRALRFDIYITTPHSHLLHCLLALSRWMDSEAWTKSRLPAISLCLLQDCYHTTLPLSLPPHTLATAAIYLAVLCSRLCIPGSSESGRKWWQVFSPDSSEADLQHIARQIMAFYEDSRSPSKMDQPGEGAGSSEDSGLRVGTTDQTSSNEDTGLSVRGRGMEQDGRT